MVFIVLERWAFTILKGSERIMKTKQPKQKTAMQELIQELYFFADQHLDDPAIHRTIMVCIELAKAKEPINKQQIIDARINDYPPTDSSKNLGEQYYNETYESD